MRTTTTLDKDEHSTLCYDDKVRRATVLNGYDLRLLRYGDHGFMLRSCLS